MPRDNPVSTPLVAQDHLRRVRRIRHRDNDDPSRKDWPARREDQSAHPTFAFALAARLRATADRCWRGIEPDLA